MISKASWASSFSASFPESMHYNNSSASGQHSEKITVAAHHLSACSQNPTHPAKMTWSSSKILKVWLVLLSTEQTLYTLVSYTVGLLSYSWSQCYIHLKSIIKANCIFKWYFAYANEDDSLHWFVFLVFWCHWSLIENYEWTLCLWVLSVSVIEILNYCSSCSWATINREPINL